MKVDSEALQRHYASLSDGEFLALERDELTPIAQKAYDHEAARRKLTRPAAGHAVAEDELPAEETLDQTEYALDESEDLDEAPEWLQDSACACAFTMNRVDGSAPDASVARAALRKAGIPCHAVLTPPDQEGSYPECCIMVPGGLLLHATSILDRDLFNARQEADWRALFEGLSDEEFAALSPDVFCAGLLDRVARLKRVYTEEAARRRE